MSPQVGQTGQIQRISKAGVPQAAIASVILAVVDSSTVNAKDLSNGNPFPSVPYIQIGGTPPALGNDGATWFQEIAVA